MAAMRNGKVAVLAAAMLLLLLLAGEASAATCNAGALAACVPAITSGATPTAACCANMRAQRGCFCEFARNPAYGRYVSSPNARRTVASCGVSLPRC
ncbi:hypothetical protein ACP70R_002081 [Stipagrostis hirtigluma subsp. patula]